MNDDKRPGWWTAKADDGKAVLQGRREKGKVPLVLDPSSSGRC